MRHVSFLVASLAMLLTLGSHASVKSAEKPAAPRFADASKARYISGELVYIDPVNRRGGIRLDGDQGRYFSGPPHWFALLPYASVWHHGARAELRDLPLGTHVHGYFVTPPAGEEATIPPLPDDKKQFAIAENHALLIEDDFSFYQRRGQAWKVVSIDVAKEKIKLEPIATGPAGAAKAPVPMKQGPLLPGGNEPGKLVKAGINTPFTFDIDGRSEIWQGRQLVELGAIRPGDNVQFNLAWCQGWGQGEFRVGRLWLDEESRTRATERQRQRHVQYERERWTAGWIDHIEHFDYGGGIVTATPAATAPPTCRSCWRGAAIGTVNISLETRGITPRWRSCTSTCCRGSACQRTSSAPALVPLRN